MLLLPVLDFCQLRGLLNVLPSHLRLPRQASILGEVELDYDSTQRLPCCFEVFHCQFNLALLIMPEASA